MKKTKTVLNNSLALLLALVMLLSMLPVGVLAEEAGENAALETSETFPA